METNGRQTDTGSDEQELSAAEALNHLLQQVGELQQYFAHFVSAKIDGVKLSMREVLTAAALGVVGFIAVAGVIVTAIVLVLTGAAAGVALLFDGQLWLGQLVVGIAALLFLGLITFIGLRIRQRRSRQQKVQYYGERQLQQHAVFGHSVADRATEDTAV